MGKFAVLVKNSPTTNKSMKIFINLMIWVCFALLVILYEKIIHSDAGVSAAVEYLRSFFNIKSSLFIFVAIGLILFLFLVLNHQFPDKFITTIGLIFDEFANVTMSLGSICFFCALITGGKQAYIYSGLLLYVITYILLSMRRNEANMV